MGIRYKVYGIWYMVYGYTTLGGEKRSHVANEAKTQVKPGKTREDVLVSDSPYLSPLPSGSDGYMPAMDGTGQDSTRQDSSQRSFPCRETNIPAAVECGIAREMHWKLNRTAKINQKYSKINIKT